DGRISEAEKQAMRKLIEKRSGKPKGPTNPSKPMNAPAKPGPSAGFPDGANCLFIGHSFFVPVARSFDALATASDFPDHQAQLVFSPGQGGSPGQLWENPEQKKKIEAILATGEIELFGMTVVANQGTIEDYNRWINLALKYNPKTKIMIGQYWMASGPNLKDEQFEMLTEMLAEQSFEDVEELRRTYPNRIYFVHYGHVGPEMKTQFSAGNLPDIQQLVGLGKDSLFRDNKIGHAGPLMHELCALTWTATLYQAGLKDVNHSDFSDQAAAIARSAIQNNQQYR
ncbi:MAG: hypothetical protein AAGH89_11560, partial [Verrucomicrobiota bacterium]